MRNRKLSCFAAAAACALLLAGCAASRRAATAASLAGEWEIESVDGLAVDKKAGESVPFLGFDTRERRVWGSTSCNRLTGHFRHSGDSIDLGQIGCTMMMCRDMEVEQRVLAALRRVGRYTIDDADNLVLTTAEGTAVITLKRRK